MENTNTQDSDQNLWKGFAQFIKTSDIKTQEVQNNEDNEIVSSGDDECGVIACFGFFN